MRALAVFLFAALFACGRANDATPVASAAAPGTDRPASSEAPPAPAAAAPVTDASTPPLQAADAEPPPAPPAPPPPPVERTGKTWPFHAWDRAEAVTFNQFAMRPEAPLYAYDEHGWSPHLVDKKPLSIELGKTAVDLVAKTHGDVAVSKCPFPRHAVILYDGAMPVASINVCFQCGDILLWPPYKPKPDWSKMSDKQKKERMLEEEKQMKLYDRVFPRWQTFFRDDVGFPIDATYR